MKDLQNSKLHQLISFDKQYNSKGHILIGIDEAGRGPLCGPVVAAAVVLNNFDSDMLKALKYLNDSKKFSGRESKREEIYEILMQNNCIYSIAEGSLEDIEKINIYQTTYKTMFKAYQGLIQSLNGKKHKVLVDGHRKIKLIPDKIEQEPIVKGDGKSASIAAASILAKVYRDRLIKDLSAEFPQYKWEKNKGYATKDHIEAIRIHGRCKYHRMGFKVKGLDYETVNTD